MKKTKMISVGLLGALFFAGCAQRELVFTQDALCQAPIANVYLQGVHKKEGQGTIAQDAFTKILEQIMRNTGCVNFASSPQEGVYTLNATYEVKVQNEEAKSTFKTKTNNILIAKVVLNLNNHEVIRRDYGESKIAMEENKVLGVGESEQLSQDDEKKALQSSALAALKSFISSLQTAQNTEQETQVNEEMEVQEELPSQQNQ